jgi:hypothetical protein
MSSHGNQALQTVLRGDEAAMGESLFSKVLPGYVGQSLASKAEVWQVLSRDIVGDVCEKLIGEFQELLGMFSVRS